MDDKLSTDKNDFLKEIGDAEKFGIIEEEGKRNKKIIKQEESKETKRKTDILSK